MTTPDRPNVAVDGFSWGDIRIHNNSGLDIAVGNYTLRVQHRHGVVQVIWNGWTIFKNGSCNPLTKEQSMSDRLTGTYDDATNKLTWWRDGVDRADIHSLRSYLRDAVAEVEQLKSELDKRDIKIVLEGVEASKQATREEGMEATAKLAEDGWGSTGRRIAAAIRALAKKQT